MLTAIYYCNGENGLVLLADRNKIMISVFVHTKLVTKFITATIVNLMGLLGVLPLYETTEIQ